MCCKSFFHVIMSGMHTFCRNGNYRNILFGTDGFQKRKPSSRGMRISVNTISTRNVLIFPMPVLFPLPLLINGPTGAAFPE